jgi:hypothetical protein
MAETTKGDDEDCLKPLEGRCGCAHNGAHEPLPGPMSTDHGATKQPELDRLVYRARTELRDWTDRAENDPGVALLELFALVGDLLDAHTERLRGQRSMGSARRDDGASVIEFGDGVHGQRPPSGSSIGVHHTSAGTYSSVFLHQGRVVLDTDQSEAPPRATCGLYRATVIDNADPLVQQRLLVQIPEVTGDQSMWAAACLPASGTEEVPAIGAGVWVAFESGDPSRPVWLGRRFTA